jgi:acetylxylan esterase
MYYSILAVGGFLTTLALSASLTQVSNYNNNATSKAQMYA